MPSPIGHALAGLAAAWSTRSFHGWTLPLVCMALAVFPDMDLLYVPLHRTVTHSLGAVIVVIIVAAVVTGWVNGHIDWRIVLLCGAAYGSHILLDMLSDDPSQPSGVQALWPFSDHWYVSSRSIFQRTERIAPFSAKGLATNVVAVATEIAILAPIVLALGFIRRRKNRAPTFAPNARQPPSA